MDINIKNGKVRRLKRVPQRDLKNIRDSGFGKKTRNVIEF